MDEPVVADRREAHLLKLRFLLGGAFNAGTGVALSQLAYLVIGRPVVAFGVGYVLSLSLSYVVNALLVFRVGRLSVRGYLGFCLSYVPNFLVQVVLVAALTRWLDVYPLVAYVIGVLIAVPVTFLILDRVTFGGRRHAPALR